MKHQIINGHRYFSPAYQRVIVAASHGKFEDGGGRPTEDEYVVDTSGIVMRAEDFRPFKGGNQ